MGSTRTLLRFGLIWSCFCLVACRSTVASDADTSGFRDSGFLRKLYLLPGKSVSTQKVSFHTTGVFLLDWDQLPAGVKKLELDDAFSALPESFLKKVQEDRYLTGEKVPFSLSIDPQGAVIKFGSEVQKLPIMEANGRSYLEWEAMRRAVSRCPFSKEALMKSPLVEWAVKQGKLDTKKLAIQTNISYFTSVYWRHNGARLSGSCELSVHDGKNAVQFALNSEYNFEFSEPIFDFPLEDKSKGMFFASGDLKPFTRGGRQKMALILTETDDPNKMAVSRLDISKKVGIDDLRDSEGQPLNSEGGVLVSTTLRQLVKQLRAEVPELGRQLVLVSEDPSVESTISFRIDPTIENPGVASCAESDVNGTSMACQVVVWVGSKLLWPYIEAMQKIGLVADFDREVNLVNKAVITHEFGHALGLAHNFGGLYLNNAGEPVMSSIMGYPFGLPFDLIKYDAKFFPQDVLALKFIYADSIAKDQDKLQQDLLQKLAEFPLIPDYDDGPENLTKPSKKLEFMTKLKSPALDRIKTHDSNVLSKLKKIYDEYLAGS